MFAVVQSGGKQYRVNENDIITVEKLANAVGDKVNLEVCFYAVSLFDVIVVFKYKPKKNERKKQGHRQPFTQLKILSIKK